jgi:hypothetical protein
VRSHTLRLRSGLIDTGPRAPVRAISANLAEGTSRIVLQLEGPMTRQRRARLAAAGIGLEDYLPANAFIARLGEAGPQALSRLEFVRWASPFERSWKLDPDLGRRSFKTDARIALAEQGLVRIVVILFAGEEIEPAIRELAAVGATVSAWNEIGNHWFIDAAVRAAEAPKLTQVEAVQFIEEAPEGTPRNDTNAWIVQSNVNAYTPIWDAGLHGEGQMAGLIDGTINAFHCAFEDAAPVGPTHRKIVAMRNAGGIDAHGTHTAGTLAGDSGIEGVYDQYDGIAFAARISFSDYWPIYLDTSTLYARLLDAHNDGARVHSNSWGDDNSTSYTTWCRQIDQFSYDYEENLVVFAVTNYSTLKTPENAKNVLAVGASKDTPFQDEHCYGGTGPTADGRRKPEIFAPGCGTLSADANTPCNVRALTGTSMACPAVAGAGLLVRQYFMEGFYPSGAPTPTDALTPSGALIKAVLINSAVDMTDIPGYPSDQEGWGRLLLDNALYLPGDAARMFVRDVRNVDGLDTGEETAYEIVVTGSDAPLRITLVFTDPPASLSASDPVINDLDLTVTAPDGTVYRGNHIVDGQSITGGSYDAINNVEQVILPSPSTGSYNVRVTGTAVNVNTQGYALVMTGDLIVDCNDNGLSDLDDIAMGTSEDCDTDAVPDECQPDFDGDGSIDACDLDDDDDGVPDDTDVCKFTLPGTPVDGTGKPISDTQGNCEIDLVDYTRFQECLLSSGPEIRAFPDTCIGFFDYDEDTDVDLMDFLTFQNTFTDSE